MAEPRAFAQVDVFAGGEPLLGNPVAVVLDGEGLTVEQMQRFTDWTNLSEATFVTTPSSPEADYAVRIFMPGAELPFAGHPTLGTCHAWLAAGGQPREDPERGDQVRADVVVQECGVGLVPIRRDGANGELSFRAPPRRRSGPLDHETVLRLARGLRIDPAEIVDHHWCDNGPPWQVVMLPSAAAVLAVDPDPAVLAGLDVGVVGPHGPEVGADFEVRAFFPTPSGLREDPVTGSLNGAVGQWLTESGSAADRYVATQGTRLGRSGRVTVERIGDDVWVGGRCVSVIEGTASL